MTVTYVSNNAPTLYSGRLNIDNIAQDLKKDLFEFYNQIPAIALHQFQTTLSVTCYLINLHKLHASTCTYIHLGDLDR